MSQAFLLLLIAVTLFCHFSAAVPAQVKQPFVPRSANLPLKRSTSQDPSCPSGYLCVQDVCPANVLCKDGEMCVNFEGTLACVSNGSSWCALNPSTFQGVGCLQGVCCHGNCYIEGTVCCIDTSVVCTIGERCNACPSGQTCGSDGCIGSSDSTFTPPASTPTPSPPATNPTGSVPSPTPTTSILPTQTVSPGIPPTSGTFSFVGCYADALGDRVLTNGSIVDNGSTGMTVEKCTGLAAGYQFAGLEFSAECYWGNFPAYRTIESLVDCNMPCDGNSLEICGGENRILIYQDTAWVLLSDPEFVAQLQVLYGLLQRLQLLIQQWYEDLQSYITALKAATQNQRRQIGLTSLQQAGLAVNLDQKAIMALLKGQDIRTFTLQLKLYLDIKIKQAQQAAKLAAIEYENTADIITTAADKIVSSVNTVPIVADGVTPTVEEVAAVSAVVDTGTTIVAEVGVSATVINGVIVAAATGLFAALDAIIAIFSGSKAASPPKGGGPTQTIKTTSTKTTSSSTTCTATATQTPIIIVTKKGTTLDQFNDMVKSLPKNADNQQYTSSWQPNFIYIATLDQCTSEKLTDNPIVEAWSIDAELEVDDPDISKTSSTTKRSASHKPHKRGPDKHRKAQVQRGNKTDHTGQEDILTRNFTVRDLHFDIQGRSQPVTTSIFKQQVSSPGHLQWLSTLSRYTQLSGNFYSFNDLVYNDPPTVGSPIIYVVDTGFINTHEAYGKRVIGAIGIDSTGQNLVPQSPPPSSHGTCIASLAAGTYSSMGKNARVVTVQLDNFIKNNPVARIHRASRAVFAIMQIYRHAINNNGQGNAVVTMSWSVQRPFLYWPSTIDVVTRGDVFDVFLPWLWDLGIATVCSAGNDGASFSISLEKRDLSYNIPRGKGGFNSNMIVVGNNDYNNIRVPTSGYLDAGNLGILTLYNVGDNVDCAVASFDDEGILQPSDISWKVEDSGTSQATAITAGMIAYYLSQPELNAQFHVNGVGGVPLAVKKYLLRTANQFKFDASAFDGIPRAALGDVVPCVGGTASTAGRPAILPPFVPNPGFLRPLTLTQVTDGQIVVVNPLPSCFDLP